MAKILILQGPNLNLLGKRQPAIYGKMTLEEIHQQIDQQASLLKLQIDYLQSNAEHELINAVHHSMNNQTRLIIVNPGAYTHTSIALRDAFLATSIPFIEVHLSQLEAREPFRQHSYLADIAWGRISGFGALGYQLALQAAHHYLQSGENYGYSQN